MPCRFFQILGQIDQFRRGIEAEDELNASVLVPAIQVPGLREVGIAPQEHRAKATLQTGLDTAVECWRCSLMTGTIAGAIDHGHHFAGVRQRDDQRMITPGAIVADVHALLARASGCHHGAIDIEPGLGEEVGWLLTPHLLTGLVKDVFQGQQRVGGEATAEVAGGRRIGKTLRAQQIKIDFVVLTAFDVLETVSFAEGVVGDVENMIRFVIASIDFQQRHLAVEAIRQAQVLHEGVQWPQATMRQAACLVGKFNVNRSAAQGRTRRSARSTQPRFQRTLAAMQSLR